jgi:hypothetical protein
VTTPKETAEPGRPVRHEHVRALVEHSWVRPEAPRPHAKPHIVLMITALAAAGAVVTGVLLQMIHPIQLPKPAVPTPPPAPGAPFTAVAGWDCTSTAANYGFEAQGRTSAWITVARGGWTQNGCDGTFAAIPMMSNKAAANSNQSAEWWFKPTAAMTQCTIMIFRPAPQLRQDSAATAAQFDVLSGENGSQLAGFVLNEAADPGTWATAGTFPVSPDGIAVELVPGVAHVPADAAERLAVTQVKVRCTG